MRGDEECLAEWFNDEGGKEPKTLAVTQRRPLAQSSLEEFRKYLVAPINSAAVLIATANPDGAKDCELPTRSLKDLVKYLADKSAGGVVNLSGLIIYMFPHCSLAEELLSELAPKCRLMHSLPQESLLVIVVKSGKK